MSASNKVLWIAPESQREIDRLHPQRRRVVIIGASVAGIAAAQRLGEHCTLLEQRAQLRLFFPEPGGPNDCSSDWTLGAAGSGNLGSENRDTDDRREGVSKAERKAIVISCSTGDSAAANQVIRIDRWMPPELPAVDSPPEHRTTPCESLSGEVRLNARVTRVFPLQHRVEIEGGESFVYDKLVNTAPLASFDQILGPDRPAGIRSFEFRHWLHTHDIELADAATRELLGQEGPAACGRMIGERVQQALRYKFHAKHRLQPLFTPRVVTTGSRAHVRG